MPHRPPGMLRTRIRDLYRRIPEDAEDLEDTGVTSFAMWFTTRLCPPPDNQLQSLYNEYRYSINDYGIRRQAQKDHVFYVIVNTIRQLSVEHMIVAATRIQVWPNVTRAGPIWPVTFKNTDSYIRFYAFKGRYEEFAMSVPVAMFDRSSYPTADKLSVRVKCKWVPLRDWLLSYSKHTDFLDPIKAQQIWWSKTGKSFRLMDLPAELRLIIFEQALGSPIHPKVRIRRNTREKHVSIPCADMVNILQVSKTVNTEALKAGWNSRKYFTEDWVFEGVVSCTKPPIGYNWISRIELDLSISKYFRFFGVNIHPRVHITASDSKGPLLRNIQTIRHLCMQFPSPLDDPANNPWGDFFAGIGFTHPDIASDVANNLRETHVPCQRKIVDWILNFAFPFIKHIPRVTLAGFVKSSSKRYWEDVLAKEYIQRNEDYRTHGYVWEDEIAPILYWPAHCVPQCDCPFPCDSDSSSGAMKLLYKTYPDLEDIMKQWYTDHLDAFDFDDDFTPDFLYRAKMFQDRTKVSEPFSHADGVTCTRVTYFDVVLFGPDRDDLESNGPKVKRNRHWRDICICDDKEKEIEHLDNGVSGSGDEIGSPENCESGDETEMSERGEITSW